MWRRWLKDVLEARHQLLVIVVVAAPLILRAVLFLSCSTQPTHGFNLNFILSNQLKSNVKLLIIQIVSKVGGEFSALIRWTPSHPEYRSLDPEDPPGWSGYPGKEKTPVALGAA